MYSDRTIPSNIQCRVTELYPAVYSVQWQNSPCSVQCTGTELYPPVFCSVKWKKLYSPVYNNRTVPSSVQWTVTELYPTVFSKQWQNCTMQCKLYSDRILVYSEQLQNCTLQCTVYSDRIVPSSVQCRVTELYPAVYSDITVSSSVKCTVTELYPAVYSVRTEPAGERTTWSGWRVGTVATRSIRTSSSIVWHSSGGREWLWIQSS